MLVRGIILCAALLHAIPRSFAYNLQLNEEMANFIVSSVINVLGVRNSTDSVLQLPNYVEPSYFGYRFSLYEKADGGIGMLAGSPKFIDPTNPAFQDPSVAPRQDPKGSIKSCSLSGSFYPWKPPICQLLNPSNPKPGDNFGLVVPLREDGNAMACSSTRKQKCQVVQFNPGVCFMSRDFGKTWNATAETRSLKCPTTNVEVLFVLDGSGSVGLNFDKVKTWVKEITQKIGIDQGLVTVGVVQYSHYTEDYDIHNQPWIVTHIKIGEYKEYASFAAEVDEITLQGYTTHSGRALQKVITDFQATKNYNKASTKQVMILLTDGMASDSHLIPENAERLRNIGVIPYAVGVGSEKDVNRTELQLIANGNTGDNTRVFMVAGFDGLAEIAKELEAEIGGLVLEGGAGASNMTGYDLQFGQLGFSIAYSKADPQRTRRDASTKFEVNFSQSRGCKNALCGRW